MLGIADVLLDLCQAVGALCGKFWCTIRFDLEQTERLNPRSDILALSVWKLRLHCITSEQYKELIVNFDWAITLVISSPYWNHLFFLQSCLQYPPFCVFRRSTEIRRRKREERKKNTAEQVARMRQRQHDCEKWKIRRQQFRPYLSGLAVALVVGGFLLYRYCLT